VTCGDLVIGADSHTCTYGGLAAFATGVGSTDFASALWSGEVWLKVPPTMRCIFFSARKPWVYGKDLILKVICDLGVDGARYRALEFGGETIRHLPMPERLTMCNMAIEAGAKNGIVAPDRLTRAYLRGRSQRTPRFLESDPDAGFIETREYDCRALDPLVARPHLPSNAMSVYAFKRTEIDQVVIGSCTNGWYEDLRIAARLLAGRRVSRRVRLLIIPGTHDIYCRALRSGLIRCLADAGAVIAPASCGPCLGGHLGVLARGERCVATTNRNFLGRMGHTESEVYLANPAVAAASALLGRIAGPDELPAGGAR
jgi:3-isopropylmalate/(R)-2-methylmalate dehydratase large subunit